MRGRWCGQERGVFLSHLVEVCSGTGRQGGVLFMMPPLSCPIRAHAATVEAFNAIQNDDVTSPPTPPPMPKSRCRGRHSVRPAPEPDGLVQVRHTAFRRPFTGFHRLSPRFCRSRSAKKLGLQVSGLESNPHSQPGSEMYARFVSAWERVPDKTLKIVYHGTQVGRTAFPPSSRRPFAAFYRDSAAGHHGTHRRRISDQSARAALTRVAGAPPLARHMGNDYPCGTCLLPACLRCVCPKPGA